jgi:hypothetical protein
MCSGFTFCLLNSRTRFRDPCPVYVSVLYLSVAPRFMRLGYLRFSTFDLLAYADSLLAYAI